jgi:hypothetical protein
MACGGSRRLLPRPKEVGLDAGSLAEHCYEYAQKVWLTLRGLWTAMCCAIGQRVA